MPSESEMKEADACDRDADRKETIAKLNTNPLALTYVMNEPRPDCAGRRAAVPIEP